MAARVEDLNYLASNCGLEVEDCVMTSIYCAKLENVGPGSTEQGIVVGEPCRYGIATAVKLIVSVAAVERVIPKLPIEEIVSLVTEQNIISVEADDEIGPDTAEDAIVPGPATYDVVAVLAKERVVVLKPVDSVIAGISLDVVGTGTT